MLTLAGTCPGMAGEVKATAAVWAGVSIQPSGRVSVNRPWGSRYGCPAPGDTAGEVVGPPWFAADGDTARATDPADFGTVLAAGVLATGDTAPAATVVAPGTAPVPPREHPASKTSAAALIRTPRAIGRSLPFIR